MSFILITKTGHRISTSHKWNSGKICMCLEDLLHPAAKRNFKTMVIYWVADNCGHPVDIWLVVKIVELTVRKRISLFPKMLTCTVAKLPTWYNVRQGYKKMILTQSCWCCLSGFLLMIKGFLNTKTVTTKDNCKVVPWSFSVCTHILSTFVFTLTLKICFQLFWPKIHCSNLLQPICFDSLLMNCSRCVITE